LPGILTAIAGILGPIVTILSLISSHHTAILVPQIEVFKSIPPEIIDGGEATLSWSVSGGKDAKVAIDQGIGEQPLVGTTIVHPGRTTAYTLTAKNSEGKGGSLTATVIVLQKNAISPSQNSPKEIADEIPSIVVDQMGRGDYTTISQAIAAAVSGSKITIRKGVYNEGIVIDKALEIVGEGNLGDVVIRAKGVNAILFKAVSGIVSNIMIKQNSGGNLYCVSILEGCLELKGCDITSDSSACIGVRNDAYPKLTGNKIHSSKQSGIFIYGDAEGQIEGNDIYGNTLSGIEIKDNANPTISNNKIHDGKASGIYIHGDAEGQIEGNDIYGNKFSGITIKDNANPTISNNKIHDGKMAGILINTTIKGIIEENQIYGNSRAGIEIREGGSPIVRKNIINNNRYSAIWIHDNAGGTFENNDLIGNKMDAWDISKDSESRVIKSGNIE